MSDAEYCLAGRRAVTFGGGGRPSTSAATSVSFTNARGGSPRHSASTNPRW